MILLIGFMMVPFGSANSARIKPRISKREPVLDLARADRNLRKWGKGRAMGFVSSPEEFLTALVEAAKSAYELTESQKTKVFEVLKAHVSALEMRRGFPASQNEISAALSVAVLEAKGVPYHRELIPEGIAKVDQVLGDPRAYVDYFLPSVLSSLGSDVHLLERQELQQLIQAVAEYLKAERGRVIGKTEPHWNELAGVNAKRAGWARTVFDAIIKQRSAQKK